MDVHYITDFSPVTGDKLISRLGLFSMEPEDELLLREMAEDAKSIARPKAVFLHADIEELGEEHIIAGGERFDSRLLRQNIEGNRFILPYCATCGRELEEWSEQYAGEMLLQFAADTLKEMYLEDIEAKMRKEAKRLYYGEDDISSMAPGSLEREWPVTQQRPLFALLGEHAKKIGLHLTESCLMLPGKSISGFYFSSSVHFESCALCVRKNCPKRRVAGTKSLYQQPNAFMRSN